MERKDRTQQTPEGPELTPTGASLIALMAVALFLASALVRADITPVREAETMKVLYSGNFAWKGSTLRFDIGARQKLLENGSRFVAVIKDSRGKTQATCRRELTGNLPYDVNSMTLSCQGRIQSLVKFSFADTMKRPKLLLSAGKRFKEVELTGI